MIKITFEVSEDFIRESAKTETAVAKMKVEDGKSILRGLIDMMIFAQFEKQIDEGKTEFVVTTDKLDDKAKEVYNNEIGDICMLAVLSEIDMKEEKTAE